MNLEYLRKVIIPTRKKEIEKGLNWATRQPIYVVLDLQENYVSGHTDYTPHTNYKGLVCEYGYIDNSIPSEERIFLKDISRRNLQEPIKVTRFYTDKIIAFFLTSAGAYEYLKYQSHNLTNPYVYVFYSGYGNKEMDNLLRVN